MSNGPGVHYGGSRHTHGHGVFPLADRPVEHGEVLLRAGRRQIDQIRDVRQQRDVEEPEVRRVVHARRGPHEYGDHRRIPVDAEVLRELVVAALDEGAVHAVHGAASGLCDA